MSPSGLPVGLNLEGPIDSDSTILAIGIAIESLLGPLPAPQLWCRRHPPGGAPRTPSGSQPAKPTRRTSSP
jgi:hypothetical protein